MEEHSRVPTTGLTHNGWRQYSALLPCLRRGLSNRAGLKPQTPSRVSDIGTPGGGGRSGRPEQMLRAPFTSRSSTQRTLELTSQAPYARVNPERRTLQLPPPAVSEGLGGPSRLELVARVRDGRCGTCPPCPTRTRRWG